MPVNEPGAIAFPDQALAYVVDAAESFPADRSMPPDDEEAAYAQLTGAGVDLPDGSWIPRDGSWKPGDKVVLKPGDAGEVKAIQPLIYSLSGEWLAVAARGLDEAHLIDILRDLTFPKWSRPGGIAMSKMYCTGRKALVRAILGGMLKRKTDIPGFLRRLSLDAAFVTAVQNCAGDDQNGPFLVFWLEVSGQFGSRGKSGRLVRRLHPAIFEDKMLALEAAKVGNLAVLKCLDSDGYDVRGKIGGGGCCGGGKFPIDVARKNGHTECVTFIDELKLYPPVIRYDPANDEAE